MATIALKDVEGLTYHTMPADAGQIVEYSYALWADGCGGGVLVRRRHDRSDRETTYSVADLLDPDEEFEPWNGSLPSHGEFEDI